MVEAAAPKPYITFCPDVVTHIQAMGLHLTPQAFAKQVQNTAIGIAIERVKTETKGETYSSEMLDDVVFQATYGPCGTASQVLEGLKRLDIPLVGYVH